MSRKKFSFDKTTVKRILPLLGSRKGLALLSLLCAAVSSLLTLAVPLLIGNAIDLMFGVGNVDLEGVGRIALLIALCTAVSALAQWLMDVLNNRITYAMVYSLRREAFNKLQKLPISYLDSHSSGEMTRGMGSKGKSCSLNVPFL